MGKGPGGRSELWARVLAVVVPKAVRRARLCRAWHAATTGKGAPGLVPGRFCSPPGQQVTLRIGTSSTSCTSRSGSASSLGGWDSASGLRPGEPEGTGGCAHLPVLSNPGLLQQPAGSHLLPRSSPSTYNTPSGAGSARWKGLPGSPHLSSLGSALAVSSRAWSPHFCL